MSIIIAILIFGIIIFVHELGHFITAKKAGVLVHEFAIGMGPKIFSKQKGDTVYSLRLVPFGGFCAMEGENSESESEKSFGSKKPLKRILILAAGAIMNLLLGLLCLTIMTIFFDEIILTNRIGNFKDNASSAQSLQVGDEILKIGNTTVFTSDDIRFQLLISENDTYDVTVRRDGKKMKFEDVRFNTWAEYYYDAEKGDVKITPETPAPTGAEIKKFESPFDFTVIRQDKNFLNVTGYIFKAECTFIQVIFTSLRELLTGHVGLKEMSGPVGIVGTVAQTVDKGLQFKENAYNLLFITMLISINVGVFNLLPVPALDGGRIVFVIIEMIRRKKVKPQVEATIHNVVLALLMAFIFFISISDISNLIKNLSS